MGAFSDMDMGFTDGTGSPFEDEGAFGQTPEFEQTESMPVSGGQMVEEMELPVPQAGSRRINDDTDSKQEEAKKDCSGEMVASMKISDKPELDADNKKAQAAAEEEKRRTEHEAAEAQRKAEWDAAQEAKKAAELEQLDHLKAMSDDEIMEASVKRVSRDTERLTRRNMKECVSEYIQTLCFSDPVFARLTMQPHKTIIHCFYYINRKAMEFVQQEMKDNGIKPEGPYGAYGSDIPDDMCYQWAEEYFRDPNAEEDKEKEEKFVPKPYIGKTSMTKAKSKKAAEKKVPEKKEPEKKPEPEVKKDVPEGQMSLLDLAMPKSA